jgi:hypothetical protein
LSGGVASAKNAPDNLTGSVVDAENQDVVFYTSASESLKSDPVLPFTIRIYLTMLSPTKAVAVKMYGWWHIGKAIMLSGMQMKGKRE